MIQQSRFAFSRRNAVFLGLCLGGFVLLLGVSVIPLRSQQQALDQKVASLSKDLTNQRQNQASIAIVDGILAKLDQQPGPQLSQPAPLPQDKTDQISEDIKALAQENALTLTAVEPVLDGKKTWQKLTVRAEMRGTLPQLRPFLLKLLALPYVRQVDRIEIHPGNMTLKFSLTYTIDLA